FNWASISGTGLCSSVARSATVRVLILSPGSGLLVDVARAHDQFGGAGVVQRHFFLQFIGGEIRQVGQGDHAGGRQLVGQVLVHAGQRQQVVGRLDRGGGL